MHVYTCSLEPCVVGAHRPPHRYTCACTRTQARARVHLHACARLASVRSRHSMASRTLFARTSTRVLSKSCVVGAHRPPAQRKVREAHAPMHVRVCVHLHSCACPVSVGIAPQYDWQDPPCRNVYTCGFETCMIGAYRKPIVEFTCKERFTMQWSATEILRKVPINTRLLS